MSFRFDTLTKIIQENDLKIGVEIGVKRGQNVANVLKNCPAFIFHAVDCWDPKLQYINWKKGAQTINEQFFNKVRARYPDRCFKHKGYSVPVSVEFTDESVDLIFVDGDHEYEGCKTDIETWFPKLKKGGFMAGHDYGHERFPGVKKAVDEKFEKVELFGDMVWLIQKI